jgi:excisionase family DNA binding protein
MSPVSPSGKRQLLDVNQAADYIGRNVAFVRRLVARREVPYFKPGRALRFATDDLDAFLASCRVEAWR